MNSLRVEKKNIYQIEVNDKGEYIEFDVEDIGLRARCYKALDKIKEIEKEYKEKAKKVKSFKDSAILEADMFEELRNAMDDFLGKGACQKIFGDRNYAEMFNDLLEELTKPREELGGKSHFDMIKISADATNKKVMDKYKKVSKKSI